MVGKSTPKEVYTYTYVDIKLQGSVAMCTERNDFFLLNYKYSVGLLLLGYLG